MESYPSNVQKGSSSWGIMKFAFVHANRYFFSLVSDISFFLIVTICVFTPFWAFYFHEFGSDQSFGAFIILLGFEFSMVGSIQLLIWFMVGFHLFNKTHSDSKPLCFWTFTKEVSWGLFIEGIKSLVIIIAATFLFIIPGIVKLIHYMFFPFVVFFNQNYKKGEIDALKHSKKLSKGLFWWIFLLCVALNFLPLFLGPLKNFIFAQVDSPLVFYASMILALYIISLPVIYLFSLLYFMYAHKDQGQMIGPPE